jgi:hypothetical protein
MKYASAWCNILCRPPPTPSPSSSSETFISSQQKSQRNPFPWAWKESCHSETWRGIALKRRQKSTKTSITSSPATQRDGRLFFLVERASDKHTKSQFHCNDKVSFTSLPLVCVWWKTLRWLINMTNLRRRRGARCHTNEEVYVTSYKFLIHTST